MLRIRGLKMALITTIAFLIGCNMSETPSKSSEQTTLNPPENQSVLAQWIEAGSKVEKLPKDFLFTEGPCWTKRNTLVFSDIPGNKIYEWDGKVFSEFVTDSKNANGITQDSKGNLLICHHGSRNVTQLGADGKLTQILSEWNGVKFNSPNDIAIDPTGQVFFTDPSYGLPRGEKLPYDAKNVFTIIDGKAVKVMAGRNQPNGLVFSLNGKRLFVADSAAGKIDVIEINGNSFSEPKLFCDAPGPDGIRLDTNGNIWAACSDGVRIISPNGDLLGTIEFPEQPANLCFGEDGKTLFVTARKGVYRVRVTMKGIMPGF